MDTIYNIAENQLNDSEIMKKMEDEHLRLKRQVRAIQTDRLQRTMGVHPLFRRQDGLLKILKSEYVDLVKNLKIANTGAHKKIDKRMKIELKRALLLRMRTEQEHDDGKIVITQWDNLIRRNHKNKLNLRKVVNANVGRIKERRAQSEKRLVSTENRLETDQLRFNTVQCENRKIREEIDSMLKDRALFNQAWDKMMKALKTGKKFLIDLFESSTLAYDQRDEWCTKLRSVQHKGKVDQMLQLQEMRDLQKAFDHEMKVYHFLAKKGVVRINKKQEERDEKMKKEAEDLVHRELLAHRKILDEIYAYTEEEKLEKIMENFQTTEQENFATYCLLTEYCAENVSLGKNLQQIRQILVDRRDWNERQQEKRDSNIEEYKKKIQEQRLKNAVLKRRLEEKEQIINNAIETISEMFTMLDCSSEPFVNLLGHKRPSRWLLDLPLRLITEKIKEYLEIIYYHERCPKNKKDAGKAKTSSRLKKYTIYPTLPECWIATPVNLIVPADPCPACVEARWFSRVTDDPEVPFSKEMAVTALKKLSNDPAYLRSDRIHPIIDCRVPRSRTLLAARNLGQTATNI